jgi:hypothetical protein
MRTQLLLGVGAITVCALIGAAQIVVAAPQTTPDEGAAAEPAATGAPALYAQARDAWYVEPTEARAAPAISAQVHDAWYRESSDTVGAPVLSAAARDTSREESQDYMVLLATLADR